MQTSPFHTANTASAPPDPAALARQAELIRRLFELAGDGKPLGVVLDELVNQHLKKEIANV